MKTKAACLGGCVSGFLSLVLAELTGTIGGGSVKGLSIRAGEWGIVVLPGIWFGYGLNYINV